MEGKESLCWIAEVKKVRRQVNVYGGSSNKIINEKNFSFFLLRMKQNILWLHFTSTIKCIDLQRTATERGDGGGCSVVMTLLNVLPSLTNQQ